MAKIELTELRPAGSELFSGSEGYMNELGESEMDGINGGIDLSPALTESINVLTDTIAIATKAGLSDLLSCN